MMNDEGLILPTEWLFPAQRDATESYMNGATRAFYDHIGVVVCGSLMPMIELRSDHGMKGFYIAVHT